MLDPFVGEVSIFPYEFAPKDWLPCDGRMLPVSNDNLQLFSLIGNRFGGDGRQTFALPKMAPPAAEEGGASLGYFMCVKGIYPSRPK